MEQLELKHLAPYLPYGVKVLSSYNEISEIDTINWSLDGHSRSGLGLRISQTPLRFRGDNLETVKLILSPLSDLTKEIEHNGEKFIPFDRLKSIYGNDLNIDYKYNITFEDGVEGSESYCYQVDLLDCYELYQHLFSWHFDVFGLIDKGLAIDINNLNK